MATLFKIVVGVGLIGLGLVLAGIAGPVVYLAPTAWGLK